MILLVAILAAAVAAAPQQPGDVLTGDRPIWELVRESDALRAFLEHRAVGAPGAVAVVVDTGSRAALRRAAEAVAELRDDAPGPFIFATFHRNGLSEPQVLSSWSELQRAVAAATPDEREAEGRAARPGPLDAVLGVAGVAPRGTRIVLVTEDGASPTDSEEGAVDGVARALKSGGLQLDAWTLGSCNGYQALTTISKSTGGTLGCGDFVGDAQGPSEDPDLRDVTLAVRHSLDVGEPLEVRVDDSVSSIRASVRARRGQVDGAVLRSPAGRAWPLSAAAVGDDDGDDVLALEMARPTATTGLWVLTASGSPDAKFDAEVHALSRLDVAASLVARQPATSSGESEVVRLREPQGATITSVRLLDQTGREIGSASRNTTRQVSRRDAPAGRSAIVKDESEWDVRVVAGKPFLVETTGNDSQGKVFTRVSNLTRVENVLIVLPPVVIDLNPTTQLLTRPGQSLQLTYDLTNNREFPQLFHFNLKDTQSFLQTLQPVEALVPAQQTIQIRANLNIRQNTPDGQKDTVTLIARTVPPTTETIKTAIVYVQQEQIYDTSYPSVWTTWKSTCTGAWDTSNCNTNTWTVEFWIKDEDSGLLSVTSNPRGVQFRQDFVSGTRDPVRAFYSASCCSRKVDLVATDLRGNSYRQTYDVGSQLFSPGEIAGISMGILAIILIVVIVVMAIILCRRKESLRLERRLGSRLGSRE